MTFTLDGPGITSVIFDRTTTNTVAGLNRVPSDNWIVDVPTDPRREVFVGDELMFGNTVPGSIHGFKYEDVDGDGEPTTRPSTCRWRVLISRSPGPMARGT